jgi:murein DD-endopeptidase MepM/ murein hydrolase activator NlpD
MKPCPAARPVTCAYGTKGSAWSTGEHGGIDHGCPVGDPVYAMWHGTVTSANWGSAYGNHIVIDHDRLPDGRPGLWAVHAHLRDKEVRPGTRVVAGQLIGFSGATGNVSGPHLHIEVQKGPDWKRGNYTDPQPWIDAGGDGMGNAWDYFFGGKPAGTLDVGTKYVTLDQSRWNPPRVGVEFAMVYLNVKPVFHPGKTAGAIRVRSMRANGDASAYHDYPVSSDTLDGGAQLITHVYFEQGDGQPTFYEVKCIGGLKSATIGTRYRKGAVGID